MSAARAWREECGIFAAAGVPNAAEVTVLGLHALASGPYRGSWSFALSGALFLTWIILAIFPMI